MDLNAHHQEKKETTESSEFTQLENILEKTEEKVNNIVQLRQFIMSINSFEEFTRNQNKMVQCLFDIEDNLRESCQVVKKSILLQREFTSKYQGYQVMTNTSPTLGKTTGEYEYDSKFVAKHVDNNPITVIPIEQKQKMNTYEDCYNNLCYDKYNIYKQEEPWTAKGKEKEKEENSHLTHSQVDIPPLSVSSNKLKASRVSDLIVKLSTSPEVLDVVSQIFGEKILESLLSSKVENNLIDNVEKTIAEIERLKQRDEEESKKISKKNDNNSLIKNSSSSNNHPDRRSNYPIPSIPNSRDDNQTQNNSKSGFGNSDVYDIMTSKCIMKKYPKTVQSILGTEVSPGNDFTFENSLRRYCKIPNMVFKNYTSPHGNYFDASLQRGGISKLEADDKLHRSKSKPKNNFNNYTISSDFRGKSPDRCQLSPGHIYKFSKYNFSP